MAEALAHLRSLGLEPRTVIDVGVGYGTPPLYEAFRGAKLLLIEPLEEFRSVLEDAARRFEADFVLAAAGERSGRITINVHPYLEGSSLLTERDDTGGITARDVDQVTIDDAVRERGLDGPFLVKVDVQGAELEVLRGASRTLDSTDVVLLEVSLFQFVEGGPQLHDVVEFMRERGFVAYDIFGGHTRPLDGALAQIDMAFVREDGRFRQNHSYGHS